MLKVIKTQKDYDAAVHEAEQLVQKDPFPESEDGIRLELLAFLISTYETEHFPIRKPDPIEAILFRMEQEGLTRRDLESYIGSRSKVSEVLSGKRRLTLRMIRGLHKKLGIPAEILIQDSPIWKKGNATSIDWDKFPVKEMAKRDWFDEFKGNPEDARDEAEELITALFRDAGIQDPESVLLRQHVRSGSTVDPYALAAWGAQARKLAQRQELGVSYTADSVDKAFMEGLVKLSFMDDGPELAMEYLLKYGIHFIVLAHLPRTHLDGAAMLLPNGNPVVALTLRYDRLDNFWFTLCHELAHVSIHLQNSTEDRFFDDLETKGIGKEKEADEFAEHGLIDRKIWDKASIRDNPRLQDVEQLARKLKVHPAIIAGRIRRELSNYRMLWPLVGNRQVRRNFPGYERGFNQLD